MSYFEDASLVMIPSGYKTSKVYSIKPTDGSGDLTFTRSNDTATRVGPDGLIEKVRTNLNLYSQDFTNAAYVTGGYGNLPSVVVNTTANPLTGGQDADTATFTAGGTQGRLLQQFSGLSTTNKYTYSIYVKAGTKNTIKIYGDVSVTGVVAEFNLSTGSVVGTPTLCTASIVSAGSGWYRCSITFNAQGAGSADCGPVSWDGEDGTVFIYGAQLESGDIATDYIATTSAAVSVGPVSGLPRLDYLDSSCPRLLLEPQRTNLATFSEQINATTVTLNAATLTENYFVSPDGYTNADKLTETATASQHRFIKTTSLGGSVDSSAYVISLFVKYAGKGKVQLYDSNQTINGLSKFNLETKSVISGTGKIEDYGNGWLRLSIYPAKDTSTTSSFFYNMLNEVGDSFYTGDGISATAVYGFQIELGAYATSYIPTLGAAVTRGADDCIKSNTFLSGQTVACAFVDYTIDQVPSEYAGIFEYRNDSTLDFYMLQFADTTSVEFRTRGTNGVENTVSASIPVGRNKVAMYRNGDRLAVFANGVKVADQTSGTAMSAFATTSENFYLNYDPAFTNYGNQLKVSQILLFAGQIFTDAQLAELTA